MIMKNERLLKSIAQARVARLLEIAKSRTVTLGASDRLAKRYVSIAQDITTHYRLPADRTMKTQVCKACKSMLIPGSTCSVRLVGHVGYVVLRCRCGEERRVFYK